MGMLRPPTARRLSEITTRWSRLDGLDGDDPDREEKWRWFLAVYRPAMIAYVRRILLRSEAAVRPEPEEVVDAFVATTFEKGWLSRASAGETRRFRAYLTTMLYRFARAYAERLGAAKRHPRGRAVVSLERLREDGVEVGAPDDGVAEEFDREWATALIARAYARLAETNPRYARAVAEKLGLRPPAPAPGERPLTPVVRHRAIRRLRHFFVLALRETVAASEDLPDEWRHLARHLP